MNMTYPNKAAAQARADSLHMQIQNKNPIYAVSVDAGQTVRWCIPYQELDINGVPIDTNWHITVDSRARKAMTTLEVANFPEWAVVASL